MKGDDMYAVIGDSSSGKNVCLSIVYRDVRISLYMDDSLGTLRTLARSDIRCFYKEAVNPETGIHSGGKDITDIVKDRDERNIEPFGLDDLIKLKERIDYGIENGSFL